MEMENLDRIPTIMEEKSFSDRMMHPSGREGFAFWWDDAP